MLLVVLVGTIWNHQNLHILTLQDSWPYSHSYINTSLQQLHWWPTYNQFHYFICHDSAISLHKTPPILLSPV